VPDSGNDAMLFKLTLIHSTDNYYTLIYYPNRMEDTIASTLSEAITWIATETMTAIEGMPTDQVDIPLEPPIGGDEMGPDSSEGSYFLARLFSLNRSSIHTRTDI
jgi:hypothetical protein